MTDLTTDVTVTIHGTEMDLVAVGEAICPAEPDVGIMRRYIDGGNCISRTERRSPENCTRPCNMENGIKVQERPG